jgi:hypothetical protein
MIPEDDSRPYPPGSPGSSEPSQVGLTHESNGGDTRAAAVALALPNAPAPSNAKHIAYNGVGGYVLPDGTTATGDGSGGPRLPNGAYVAPDGTGGVTLPNGTRCMSDGARGYLCP